MIAICFVLVLVSLSKVASTASYELPTEVHPLIWLDASDAATLLKADGSQASNGDLIATWRDKSGHNHHVSAYSDFPLPTLVTDGAHTNGRPTVRFTAENQFRGTHLRGNHDLIDDSVSYSLVYKWRDVHRVYSIDAVFSIGSHFYNEANVGSSLTSEYEQYHLVGDHGTTFSNPLVLERIGVATMTFNKTAGVLQGFHNLTKLGEVDTVGGLAFPNTFCLGSSDSSWVSGGATPYLEYFADADIFELIIFQHALDQEMGSKLWNYFSVKYGLGSPILTPCEAGSYSESGYAPCEPCPAGTTSTNSAGSAGPTSCNICTDGYFGANGEAPCYPCPHGYINNAAMGHTYCVPCFGVDARCIQLAIPKATPVPTAEPTMAPTTRTPTRKPTAPKPTVRPTRRTAAPTK